LGYLKGRRLFFILEKKPRRRHPGGGCRFKHHYYTWEISLYPTTFASIPCYALSLNQVSSKSGEDQPYNSEPIKINNPETEKITGHSLNAQWLILKPVKIDITDMTKSIPDEEAYTNLDI
jgi:hypothetical protein